MNTAKFHDIFKPESIIDRIHIVGCGAVGSLVAETLTRMGLTNITLYDFDIVCPHNIANQIYTENDIGKLKVNALAERMKAINPEIDRTLKLRPEGYTTQKLTGYIFLCVDNIDLRRRIVEENKNNIFIKGMFDFRMRLYDAQHFAADWTDTKAVTSLLNSMQFTHEEAAEETPVSACNLTLSVIPTVWTIVSLGVSNFINMATGLNYKKIIYSYPFKSVTESY
jgi:molybdopterin/thiamine biosynthesis adenylyltransferase